MASSAVVSFLGIPGWGAVHLSLPAPADPGALLPLLLQAWRPCVAAAEGRPTPALLLAALLRAPLEWQPLAPATLAQLQGPLIRHRFVCLRARPVFVWRAWRLSAGHSRWLPCLGPLPLEPALIAGGCRGWDPLAGSVALRHPATGCGCEWQRLAPLPPASIPAAPLPPCGHRHGAPDRLPAAARGL